MTNRAHRLSLTRQADLLGIGRGSLFFAPRPVTDADLKLTRRIDALDKEDPFAGSRMMKGPLRREGFAAGRLHVASSVNRMGIEVLYRRPNTSKPAPAHKIYPDLLRKLAVTHSWRYNAATELPEAGCEDDLIAAVTGQSPAIVRHYTQKVRQRVPTAHAQK